MSSRRGLIAGGAHSSPQDLHTLTHKTVDGFWLPVCVTHMQCMYTRVRIDTLSAAVSHNVTFDANPQIKRPGQPLGCR